MRDLNEGADSNRLQQYGDRASGRHPNGRGRQTRQPNRYPRFGRGCIRQIMLVQNATFRSQVYELHRLYNTQNELMEELTKKEPYGYLQAADTSQSPIPSDATNMMQHVPDLPAASTSYTKEPVTVNDEKVVPINFLKGRSIHSGPLLIGENDVLDSKHKRHSTRMFDLLLPADVYMDCEDAEKSDKEIVDESSSVNMFPRSSTRAAHSCAQNGVAARVLDDLNEPVEENFSDRAVGSVTYNFIRAGYNNLLHADKKEIIQERPFFSNEAGKNTSTVELFSTGSSKEDFSMSSEAPKPKFKKPVEILSTKNQNKRGMSVGEKQGQGVEISGRRRTPCEQNGSSRGQLATPSQPNLPQIVFGKQKLSSRVDGNTNTGRHGSTSSSGLRRTPASISMELDSSRGYPQLKKPRCCEISLQDISSISQGSRRRKSEASDGPSSKGRLSASRGGEQPAAGSAKCSRKDEKKAASSKARRSSSRSSSRGLRNCINLNSDPSSREMVGSEACIGIAPRPDDAVAEKAAENILWMFSPKERSHLDPFDTLHWFAEVVSADAAGPDEGSDLFEQMTLELEETKPEDYFRKPWKVEDQNDGGGSDDRKSNAASLHLAKPRRGRGKKRRQRRDFQRDILPGLASLSRREVTEDIQAFAALMRASGQSWQSGVTKRGSRGRDVRTTNSRARPRPQARSSAATAAEVQKAKF